MRIVKSDYHKPHSDASLDKVNELLKKVMLFHVAVRVLLQCRLGRVAPTSPKSIRTSDHGTRQSWVLELRCI